MVRQKRLSRGMHAMNDVIYYESHITTEPILESDERYSIFNDTCEEFNFRLAKLLMAKGENLEISNKDSFCTGRSSDYEELYFRAKRLVNRLRECGLIVFRMKIEAILFDEKYDKTKWKF